MPLLTELAVLSPNVFYKDVAPPELWPISNGFSNLQLSILPAVVCAWPCDPQAAPSPQVWRA